MPKIYGHRHCKSLVEVAAKKHEHSAADITGGALPVKYGGTGATTAAAARENLGAVSKSGDTITGPLVAANGNSTSLRVERTVDGVLSVMGIGLTAAGNGCLSFKRGNNSPIYLQMHDEETTLGKPLSISSGGTGATTAAAAREKLGITPENIGALPVKGGTVSGSVIHNGRLIVSDESYYASVWLQPKMGKSPIARMYGFAGASGDTTVTKSIILFRQYSYTEGSTSITTNYDEYQFPPTEADKTKSDNYEILTSKKPVSIAQGGTGATTAEQAMLNLEPAWIYPTLANGTTPGTVGGKLRYRKMGNHVYVAGSVQITPADSAIEICTMPEGYRPTGNTYKLAAMGGERIARIYINTSGKLMLEWAIDISDGGKYKANNWVDCAFDYWTD